MVVTFRLQHGCTCSMALSADVKVKRIVSAGMRHTLFSSKDPCIASLRAYAVGARSLGVYAGGARGVFFCFRTQLCIELNPAVQGCLHAFALY